MIFYRHIMLDQLFPDSVDYILSIDVDQYYNKKTDLMEFYEYDLKGNAFAFVEHYYVNENKEKRPFY